MRIINHEPTLTADLNYKIMVYTRDGISTEYIHS